MSAIPTNKLYNFTKNSPTHLILSRNFLPGVLVKGQNLKTGKHLAADVDPLRPGSDFLGPCENSSHRPRGMYPAHAVKPAGNGLVPTRGGGTGAERERERAKQ